MNLTRSRNRQEPLIPQSFLPPSTQTRLAPRNPSRLGVYSTPDSPVRVQTCSSSRLRNRNWRLAATTCMTLSTTPRSSKNLLPTSPPRAQIPWLITPSSLYLGVRRRPVIAFDPKPTRPVNVGRARYGPPVPPVSDEVESL
jgi:hypothetical protein